jgi:hypothetical protein
LAKQAATDVDTCPILYDYGTRQKGPIPLKVEKFSPPPPPPVVPKPVVTIELSFEEARSLYWEIDYGSETPILNELDAQLASVINKFTPEEKGE